MLVYQRVSVISPLAFPAAPAGHSCTEVLKYQSAPLRQAIGRDLCVRRPSCDLVVWAAGWHDPPWEILRGAAGLWKNGGNTA